MSEDRVPSRPRFDFYEIVEMRDTPRTRHQGIAGRKGARVITYAVQLDGSNESWSIDENDLITTGEFANRDRFYSGESIRVSHEGELLDD